MIVVHKYAADNSGTLENITSHYMFCLGAYRALYVVNWVYRIATEKGYWDPIAWSAGVVQTVLYIDFIYYYIKARATNDVVKLPYTIDTSK